MDSRKPRDERISNDWNNGNPTVAEMLKSTQALTVTSLANAEGGNEWDWKWRTQACSASMQEEVEVEAIYLT